MGRPRAPFAAAVAAVLALALGACSGDDPPDGATSSAEEESQSPRPTPTEEPIAPEDVVATVDVGSSPEPITLDIHPLVRTEAGLVLTLDVDGNGESYVARELGERFGSTNLILWDMWFGLRLVDLAGDVVAPPALDADDQVVLSWPGYGDSAETGRLQFLYADTGVETWSLLVPQGGLVEDIPVIDGDVPRVPEEQDPLPVENVAVVDVFPMQGYGYDLLSTTRTEETTQSLTISLGSDVLFDVDSAELSETAMAVIEDAAAELQTHEPGTVQVIGHTDNRLDEAYNQDLSERRAQAVADALADLIDTDDYPLEVSGNGETEPIASNGSERGRALNRRVELTIETQEIQQTGGTDDDLPEPPDLVATGAEGVTVEASDRSYLLTSAGARLVDGNLLVDLTVEARGDDVDSGWGPAVFDAPVPGWIDRMTAMRTMCAVAVMDGSVATFPGWHDLGDSEDRWLVLTDLATVSRIDGGDTRTSVLVYPNLNIGDTVTIQLVDYYTPANSWRLTDIPVTHG